MRFLNRYGVITLMLLVASVQLYLREDGLSSWKGGGIGMYAELHPVYTKIFIQSRSPQKRANALANNTEVQELLAEAQLYPAPSTLSELKTELEENAGLDDVVLVVWQPEFDADNQTFHLHRTIKY